MPKLTQKLTKRFKVLSPEGLADAAKECREASIRYAKCSDCLVVAADCFDAGSFEAGYDQLKQAEATLEKK